MIISCLPYFYIRFYYHLTKDFNKVSFRFFSEKTNISYIKSSDSNSFLSKLNLPQYCLEGLFIQGNKDCNISFSIPPYINSKLEVSIKQFEKYILFVKDFNLINDNNDKDERTFIDFDLTKLIINDEIKENNNIFLYYPENNKCQANEDAVIINCPVCGTANTIDEDNQVFQCFFCSASLF